MAQKVDFSPNPKPNIADTEKERNKKTPKICDLEQKKSERLCPMSSFIYALSEVPYNECDILPGSESKCNVRLLFQGHRKTDVTAPPTMLLNTCTEELLLAR